jgi:hypothetical protein
MKKSDMENVILIFISIAVIVVVYLILSGCTPSTKVRDMKVIWHDGNCLLYVDGISAKQAKVMSDEWQFKNCEVIVNENEGVKK